ncbi:type IV toxin-antitoxin system AbiEi family antitoxin domain-containing protein [Bradyrhizobium archetypum]|uniref:type IV toxin-antitoxin system AbiEi family antitoxin domain-containing protein n=1 Tax=Bradyrhizobium archetypum TaxID=2721160 RepID=UPI001F2C5261|nr:type IV toxin-antitoxin system AbiEi family antitoxin domain-containing protein [Bradyrhizobium archetypum]
MEFAPRFEKTDVLLSMAEQKDRKLNKLERTLPQGLLVDAAWMERHGYFTSLRSQYVSAGWLVQPVRGTSNAHLANSLGRALSLQRMLGSDLVVGGRTALEAQGLAHYLSQTGPSTVHLYGTRPAPGWLGKLPLKQKFYVHRAQSLFKTHASQPGSKSGTTREIPGLFDWHLTVSTPERAFLELLDELPRHESFHQVDALAEGLRSLSPRRLQTLLNDCKSVKVKRLFFWLAERHQHACSNRSTRRKSISEHGKAHARQGRQTRHQISHNHPGRPQCPCLKNTGIKWPC